ncbi:MAG TPA: ANTAR domain-containing protein [Nocardioidaceae bacterium]|nr:ANTAR domain-containing protein [Nocardioidaceae bacterium]
MDQHQLVELFATHAGLAMGRDRTVGGLLVALGTRKVIGQAIGITMARYGIDEERAFEFLIRVSQAENLKLRDVAVGVVSGELSNTERTSTPRANGH